MFLGLVDSVLDTAGARNTQQVQLAVLKQIRAYEKVLGTFCTSARLEAHLLSSMQVGDAGILGYLMRAFDAR